MTKTNRTDAVDRFVEEFLVHLNATRAYKTAHPDCTDKTAATEGSRLLGNPKVQEKISAAKAARSRRTRVTQDRVVRELARIAFLDPRKAFTEAGDMLLPHMMPTAIARAVKGIDVEVITSGGAPIGFTKKLRFDSKVRALQVLLEHVKTTGTGADTAQSFVDLVKRAAAAKKARES